MYKKINQNLYLAKKQGKSFTITQREKDCIDLLTKGFSMKMIAHELLISPRTVEYYLQCVKIKLGCSSKYLIASFFRNLPLKKIKGSSNDINTEKS